MTAASPPIFDFLHASVFATSENERHDLEQFVQASTPPSRRSSASRSRSRADNAALVGARLDLLAARARTELRPRRSARRRASATWSSHGVVDGVARGYLLDAATGRFLPDRVAEPPLESAALRALAQTAGQSLTFTCVPPGEGERLALDRDGDGFFDRDELDAGSDPADAASTPGNGPRRRRPGRRR